MLSSRPKQPTQWCYSKLKDHQGKIHALPSHFTLYGPERHQKLHSLRAQTYQNSGGDSLTGHKTPITTPKSCLLESQSTQKRSGRHAKHQRWPGTITFHQRPLRYSNAQPGQQPSKLYITCSVSSLVSQKSLIAAHNDPPVAAKPLITNTYSSEFHL